MNLNSSRRLLACLVSVLATLTIACAMKPSASDVAATVDGQKIYRADLEKYFQSQTAGAAQPLSDEQATSLRLSILDQLINNEILMRRAEKLGLLATDEEVDRKVNEMKSPYTPEEFNRHLQESKLSLDDFKRGIRRELTAEKVITKDVTSKITVTDEDIASYYNQHKADFNVIEPRYHLAHILVTISPPSGQDPPNKAHTQAEAQKKIETVMERLKAGDDFASLAVADSEDPSTAPNGGDLGMLPESALKQTDPLTREAVTKMKPGDISPIIPLLNPATRKVGAFQIVKMISMEPAGQRELSDPRVQQEIRKQLQEHREQLLKAAYLEVLRDHAKIRNYYAEEVLDKAGAMK